MYALRPGHPVGGDVGNRSMTRHRDPRRQAVDGGPVRARARRALPSTTIVTRSSINKSPANSTRSFGSQTIRSLAVRRPRMGDHDRPRAEPQAVPAGHRPVGHVGELEPLHGVEPHHPDPVRPARTKVSPACGPSTARRHADRRPRAADDRVILATGHGMLGITLAPLAGVHVATLRARARARLRSRAAPSRALPAHLGFHGRHRPPDSQRDGPDARCVRRRRRTAR